MENTISQEKILGTWKLLDFKITKPDGSTNNWGPNSNGVLIYDQSGYMSTSINSGSDVAIAELDLEKHILFYSREYKVTGPNEINHFVTNASNPSRINKNMIRSAKFNDKEELELTAKGEYGHAYLRWKKA
ncbi:MAG: lipocalin-like domain-containing protein [Gammaproteobacteria bacterium]